MKKNVLLFVLTAITLASCGAPASSSEEKVKLVEKSVDTYSVVDLMNPDVSPIVPDPQKWAEHSSKGAMTYYVHPEYQNVLYTTFEGYGKLISSSLPSSYKYSFSDNSITVKDDNAVTVFDAILNIDKMQFKVRGSLSLGSIGIDISTIARSLLADMKIETTTVIEPEDDYSTIGYEVFAKDFDLVV
jgi:hypothetical protein